MLNLLTVFPYKLDKRVGDSFVKEVTHVLVSSKFSLLPRKSIRLSQGHIHKRKTSPYPDAFFRKFKFFLQNRILDSPRFSCLHVLAMAKGSFFIKQPSFLTKALMMPITPYILNGA